MIEKIKNLKERKKAGDLTIEYLRFSLLKNTGCSVI
jgi:hypothetical protein